MTPPRVLLKARAVVDLTAAGWSGPAIASALGLSLATVRRRQADVRDGLGPDDVPDTRPETTWPAKGLAPPGPGPRPRPSR